jgi:hypothetical protein
MASPLAVKAPAPAARADRAAPRPMRSHAARPPRDKPDYHVHNDRQTETSAGTRNARGVSPGGNIFAAAPR